MVIDSNTFIIADTHFGHESILTYEPMRTTHLGPDPDRRMAKIWNNRVGEADVVLHLGDFAWKAADVARFAALLNGTKYLLRGNHDKSPKTYLEHGFAGVIDFSSKGEAAYHVAEVEGIRILFSHYPIVTDGYDDAHWRFLSQVFDRERCDINIHGHVHSMDLGERYCINASVEAIGFGPVRLGELLERHGLGKAKGYPV